MAHSVPSHGRSLVTNLRQRPSASGGGTFEAYQEIGESWVESWKEALQFKFLGHDFLAGMTVAAVALPLNLALAIASGLPPEVGLIAGAVGGAVAAIFGGSLLQVTGPAAALNFMVLGIATQYGSKGVLAAAIFTGLICLLLAIFRMGKLANWVPEAILAGFTTGVGLKLLDGQIPALFGFKGHSSELLKSLHQPAWLFNVSWFSAVCGLTVALMTVSMARWRRVPAALLGIILVTWLSNYLNWNIPEIGEIPSVLPSPKLPALELNQWFELFLESIPLALLGAVESLLSARVMDRMTNATKPHLPDLELFGQGLANLMAGFFGGMPVTGVVVRSSVNFQSGGKTRFSSLFHSILLLLAVLYLSHWIAIVPVAALAGLLCVVGIRLVEGATFLHLLKESNIGVLSFVVTAGGTVSGHLVEGLLFGGLVHLVHYWLNRGKNKNPDFENSKPAPYLEKIGIRAVLDSHQAQARKQSHFDGTSEGHLWLPNLKQEARVSKSAFVHPDASVIGKVILGENVHVAADCSIRADEGSPFFIGPDSNVQDGVVMHALKDKKVSVGGERWAIYVGKNVSMAHQALIHGPCYIGDHSFIGFKAVVHDAVVGSHCYIGIGATVVGVEIPNGKYVPHGMIVDHSSKIELLENVTDAHLHFNEDVVAVNRGLAAAYREQHRKQIAASAPDHVRVQASAQTKKINRSNQRF